MRHRIPGIRIGTGSLAGILTLLLAVLACGEGRARPALAPIQESGLPDTTFARLSLELSEPGGFFDTDNLISNETSYLHVLDALEARGVTGGAYIGVGPDQNFSYIARVRPRIAFVVDIRRDNVLQHLLFKALFELAGTRVEYLSLLHGVEPPDDPGAWVDRSISEIVAHVDGAESSEALRERTLARVDSAVSTFGMPLTLRDHQTLGRFHREFMRLGMSLRFTSHGRAPRPYYPTFRQLVVATDLSGEPGSYLARRVDYRFVREMQLRNLVVPVVGDLAGPHAVRAVGEEVRRLGEQVTAMYVSNVEFYLFRSGTFEAFAENVATLPVAEDGVLVRSYFPNFRGRHPHNVRGHFSTQSLQTLESFVEAARGRPYRSYWELTTRDALDPREAGR